jgi:hypothetical protein
MKPLYQAIAATASALAYLEEHNSTSEWRARWARVLAVLETRLPRGSGFDCGTRIDRERSGAARLVLSTEFHHMDDTGYTHWTSHRITVRPDFLDGFSIAVSGRDTNGFKDYCAEEFNTALRAPVEDWEAIVKASA